MVPGNTSINKNLLINLLVSLVIVVNLLCIAHGYHVFIIGDSIDRYTVYDWCAAHGNPQNCGPPHCSYWADNGGISMNDKRYNPSAYCNMGDYSIAFLHHFGSRPKGPYVWVDTVNLTHAPYTNTPERIVHGLDLYFDRIGIPDMVLYHSAQWDVNELYYVQGTRHTYSHGDYDIPLTKPWNDSLIEFEGNLNDRITDIQAYLATKLAQRNLTTDRINVGLRTVVFDGEGGPLIHAFNDVIRKVAWYRNVTLFDIDSDLWGSVDWNFALEKKDILRDNMHPKPHLTAMIGDKVLGLTYTSYFQLRGNTSYINLNLPKPWLGEGPVPQRRCAFRLVRVSDQNSSDMLSTADSNSTVRRTHTKKHAHILSEHHLLEAYTRREKFALDQDHVHLRETNLSVDHRRSMYYVYEKEGKLYRAGPVDSFFRLLLHLSPGDVLDLPREVIDRMHPSPQIPALLLRGINISATHDLVFNTSSGKLFLIEAGVVRPVPPNCMEALEYRGFGRNVTTYLQNVDDVFLSIVPVGPPIPNVRENSLIRWSSSREVFVIQGGKKRLISSAGVFMAHGWDFGDVLVLTQQADVDYYPRGDPVNG
jgi:hypothetical protein